MLKDDTWPDLIERLKDTGGYTSYSHLARSLGVSPNQLNLARWGKQSLSSELKAQIIVMLKEPISQSMYESLFPNERQAEVRDYLQKAYQPDKDARAPKDFWISCIDELEQKLSSADPEQKRVTAKAIAAHLKITGRELSEVRNGIRSPTIPTKLKILDKLGYMCTRDRLLELLPEKAGKKLRAFDDLRFLKRGEES